MSRKSNMKITVLFALSVSLIAAAAVAFLLTVYYRHVCFSILGGFLEIIIRKNPDFGQEVLESLKAQDFYAEDKNILSSFGYRPSDLGISYINVLGIAFLGFLAGIILCFFSFWYFHKRTSARIRELTDYLEKINTGGQGGILEPCEDEFSALQDEIYKTVTALLQTRDAALMARNNFAENLSNIAHQLKTPITSISLSVQMAKERQDNAHIADVRRQIKRLMHLEEALLLLSRIDAGTLVLDRKPTDVFTILSLASDNLYELFERKGVFIDVQEMGMVDVNVDLDWTMEAAMNLMKNCMEASEAGTTVHCSYESNPLYVQIRIWDEGEGFAKEDLPHLFERFYRGRNAKKSGVGIGLTLSKAIIEMQGGIISAFNLHDGGACFEIRFYSH